MTAVAATSPHEDAPLPETADSILQFDKATLRESAEAYRHKLQTLKENRAETVARRDRFLRAVEDLNGRLVEEDRQIATVQKLLDIRRFAMVELERFEG